MLSRKLFLSRIININRDEIQKTNRRHRNSLSNVKRTKETRIDMDKQEAIHLLRWSMSPRFTDAAIENIAEQYLKEHKKMLEEYAQSKPVSDEVFTKEELKTIKTDIEHINKHITLSSFERDKRYSVLLKIKKVI